MSIPSGASAGSYSAAARSNVSAISWNPRSTAARNSSFLLPNSANTYGWATPTRRAIRSTGVPWRPPCANSCTAASTSASRRSEAGTRWRADFAVALIVLCRDRHGIELRGRVGSSRERQGGGDQRAGGEYRHTDPHRGDQPADECLW